MILLSQSERYTEVFVQKVSIEKAVDMSMCYRVNCSCWKSTDKKLMRHVWSLATAEVEDKTRNMLRELKQLIM